MNCRKSWQKSHNPSPPNPARRAAKRKAKRHSKTKPSLKCWKWNKKVCRTNAISYLMSCSPFRISSEAYANLICFAFYLYFFFYIYPSHFFFFRLKFSFSIGGYFVAMAQLLERHFSAMNYYSYLHYPVPPPFMRLWKASSHWI